MKVIAKLPERCLRGYRPEAAATPGHLMKCIDGTCVDYAVVDHPESYHGDLRYLEHCPEVGKGRLKGTCLVFPDRPDSVSKLPALAKKLALVAVRFYAYAPERLPLFGKPEIRTMWKQAGELDLSVQLYLEPQYAPELEPFIQKFTDVRVIIDHLGRPIRRCRKSTRCSSTGIDLRSR